MSCETTRRELMALPRELDPRAAEHLESCAACARFASAFERARRELVEHRSHHLPDARFASRVSAALASDPEVIGWAAIRLLPASVALLVVLTAWAWLATPSPRSLVESAPSDDPLAWALDREEDS